MEFLLPSLIVLLLTVAVAFYVVPQMAPEVLVTASIIVLVWAIYVHATKFGVAEYERATWYYKIKEYSGVILFGILLLIGYGVYYSGNQSGSGEAIPIPTTGGGFGVIAKTVNSRVGELLRKGRISL